MRFILITAQCIIMIFAAQIVALGVILMYPDGNYEKTLLIAFLCSIFIFGQLFKHSRSRIWDMLSSTNLGDALIFLDSKSEFLLRLYAFIFLMFLFTLSLTLSLDKLLRFL